MQPTNPQVHINRPLTNVSVAYIQDANEFIADRVFPRVPVGKKSDSFFVYDEEAFARAIAAPRSGATESAGGGYDVSTSTYNCIQQSFHKDVPSDVAGNMDVPLSPYNDATEFVTRAMLLKREADFANAYFKTGVWATDETPTNKWSDYTNGDPLGDVQNAVRTIQKGCLVRPNRMLIGPEVFDALKDHPDLVDRYKHTSSRSLTVDMLSALFGVEIMVGEGVQVTSKEGQTTAKNFIFGKHALLVYAAPRPSLLMPSGGYTFTWNAYGNEFGARIRRYPMIHLNDAQRIEGDMAYDQKVVSPSAGYFFNAAVV